MIYIVISIDVWLKQQKSFKTKVKGKYIYFFFCFKRERNKVSSDWKQNRERINNKLELIFFLSRNVINILKVVRTGGGDDEREREREIVIFVFSKKNILV